MSDMLQTVLVPMHPEGRKFVFIAAVISFVLLMIWTPLLLLGAGLTFWCYYFFRDPPRVVPQISGVFVAPADGVVSQISKVIPPQELGLGPEPMNRVSIFMNLFNCHINRAPVSGKIISSTYTPGVFVNASLDKASEKNERQAIVIECGDNIRIGVVQIAGLVARRILCFASKGTQLTIGERYGLIRFGSRLDTYFPSNVAITIAVGQSTIAGETVIANLNSLAQDYPALTI